MTPLIQLSILWTVGLLIGAWSTPHWPTLLLVAIPTLTASYLYRDTLHLKQLGLISLAIGAGMARIWVAQPIIDASHIAYYNNQAQPIELVGLVVDQPDVRDNYINLRIQAETLRLQGTEQSVRGLVLVRTPRYPDRFYGERLLIRGHLETPPIFDDFSYKDYLARFGIHSMIRRPRLETIAQYQGQPIWAMLYSFKTNASNTINRILAEPYASLLNGILLGIETGIPSDLYDQFNLTGTSHIIVISGSNISLIAGIFLLIGQQLLGRFRAVPLAIVGVMLYTILVGADAAVLRAAVMGTVWLWAFAIGRPGLAINSLFASAFVLSLHNPLILWDVGFQLSFMATLGLIVLVPYLQTKLAEQLASTMGTHHLKLTLSLLNVVILITLAAQIITMPLLLYHFGRLSLVSLLTNLLILPAQPFIMTLGGLATLGGMVWLPLGQLLGYLVWLPLAWTVWMVEWTAAWPYANLNVGRFPLWLTCLLYITIGAGIWANQGKRSITTDFNISLPTFGSVTTRLYVGSVFTLTILVGLVVTSLPDGYLHVAFLDVGQGDAILITLPDGRQVLVDGGPSTTQLNWRLGQELPFWDRSLDMVINTHPDTDHLAGLVPLFERYTIGQVIESGVAHRSQLYQAWQRELSMAGLNALIGQSGQQLNFGDGIQATILHPSATTSTTFTPNNQSVVLHLQMGQVSFLLPGDIEADIEQALVRSGQPLAATVLKSPHHGSNSSSTDPFLKAVNPQIVVIQVGQDNHFGHPTDAVLDRYTEHGITIFRNDQHGTVEFITDGQRLWVETD